MILAGRSKEAKALCSAMGHRSEPLLIWEYSQTLANSQWSSAAVEMPASVNAILEARLRQQLRCQDKCQVPTSPIDGCDFMEVEDNAPIRAMLKLLCQKESTHTMVDELRLIRFCFPELALPLGAL